MKARATCWSTLFCSLLALVMLSVDATAQQAARGRGGLYGDWLVTMKFNEREFESILSFSRDADGRRTGQWISFWGMSELADVKFEEGQLSFTQVRQGRDGQTMTSTFKGTLEAGKLSGTISGERGELKVEGARRPRLPRAVGRWEIKFTMGEREINTAFVITADREGKLAVQWPSERVQHTISDVQYQRGQLTFKSKSKMEEREWESTFEGRIRGNDLTGTLKSERGEVAVEGTRAGGALIGTWNLEITSERGTRKQRLQVNPDITGLYGTIPVKKVNLQDGKVSFDLVLALGEQKLEMSFKGALEEGKLAGEMTSSRGSQKVTGKKVVRMPPRRRTS